MRRSFATDDTNTVDIHVSERVDGTQFTFDGKTYYGTDISSTPPSSRGSKQVSFAVGALTTKVTVEMLGNDDCFPESDKANLVTVTIDDAPSKYTRAAGKASAQTLINHAERRIGPQQKPVVASIRILATDTKFDESDKNKAIFGVYRSNCLAPVSLTLSLAEVGGPRLDASGSSNAIDHGTEFHYNFHLADGQRFASATILDVIGNDSAWQPDSIITVRLPTAFSDPDLQRASGFEIHDVQDSATFTITDDQDPPPVPVLSFGDFKREYTKDELQEGVNSGFAFFGFTVDGVTEQLDVRYEVSGNLAQTPGETLSQRVFPGDQNLIANFNPGVTDDASLTVKILPWKDGPHAGPRYEVGKQSEATVRVIFKSTVRINRVKERVSESNISAEFFLNRDVNNGSMDVKVRVTQVGDFLEDNTEIRTVSFGSHSRLNRYYTLRLAKDDVNEDDGRITVSIVDPEPGDYYRVGHPSSATVAVADDDAPPPAPPTPAVSVTGFNSTNLSSVTLTLTRSGDAAGSLSVRVCTAQNCASERTATFTAGSTTTTLSVPLTAGGVNVSIPDGNGYTGGGPSSVRVAVDE